MNEQDLKKYEERLVAERARVAERLGRHTDEAANSDQDGDLTNYPLHLADEATDENEQQKDLMLASKEGRLMELIDDALRKIYKEPDRFGICETCGKQISAERLDLVPWTKYCVEDVAGEN